MKETTSKAPVDILIAYFDQIIRLNQEEKNLVATKFHPRLYRKKQYILQEGDVCHVFNFVISGCLRMHKIDESGSVHIIQFATENGWISDLGSFYSRKATVMNVEAIEDTVVLQISHEEVLAMYTQAPKFNRIFRVLVENSLIQIQERMLQYISSDARKRYEDFLQKYPHLAHRIPNTYIASYLGITPEFLSKIRNEKAVQ